ncbi:MAG: hypothetical protein ACFFG0_08370 [Candidatus Thorarchaeota archaeon]
MHGSYYDNEQIFIGTPKSSRRVRNIECTNNVTILIDEPGPPTKGVIIYDKATIDEKVLDQVAHSIFRRYISEDKTKGYWKSLSELSEWVLVIVESIRLATFDYSKDTKYLEASTKYTY